MITTTTRTGLKRGSVLRLAHFDVHIPVTDFVRTDWKTAPYNLGIIAENILQDHAGDTSLTIREFLAAGTFLTDVKRETSLDYNAGWDAASAFYRAMNPPSMFTVAAEMKGASRWLSFESTVRFGSIERGSVSIINIEISVLSDNVVRFLVMALLAQFLFNNAPTTFDVARQFVEFVSERIEEQVARIDGTLQWNYFPLDDWHEIGKLAFEQARRRYDLFDGTANSEDFAEFMPLLHDIGADMIDRG